MHSRAACWLFVALFGLLGAPAAGLAVPMSSVATVVHPYDYYAIGDLKAARPGKTEGGLMLVGGGTWPHEAFRWLVGKAGHGRIVVLRASGAEEAQDELYREVGGAASVQTIVFHAREPASDPKVLDIVRHADGIFLAGGDQSNYVRYWKGTPLSAALNQHVRDGKPLGGTSAGLAIMGAYSYGAMNGGSLTSEEALHDPRAPEVTLIDDFLVLPPLPANGVITDSHFGKRDRLGRLLVFMARVMKEHDRPDLKGIGIDENTALCIDADGNGIVFTGSGGHAWLVIPQALSDAVAKEGSNGYRKFMADRVVAGAPLDFPGWKVVKIGPQSRLRLPQFAVEDPVSEDMIDVENGRVVMRAR